MSPDTSRPSTDAHLAQRSLEGHLGDVETLVAVLTNRRVGVSRADGEAVLRVEPGSDYGAVAAVTDRRVCFLVGDPDGYDGDFADDVADADVANVERRTESLAQALLVETTDGATWEFTVREGDLDAAVATLAERLGERLLERASDACDAATSVDDREVRIAALEEALGAYQRVATLDVTVAAADENAREAAVSVISDLVAAHLDWARDRRSRGNWDAQAGQESTAAEYFADARESYERALELAESYPPGDADDVADRLASLEERIDELSLRTQILSRSDDD